MPPINSREMESQSSSQNQGVFRTLHLCKELGIERVTLYRYVGPNGELRNYGKRVLGLA